MKQMTKKNLEPHLEALGLEYIGTSFYINGKEVFLQIRDDDELLMPLRIKDLGIELIPEHPEIIQENVEKFVMKFGRFPECFYWECSRSNGSEGFLSCVQNTRYDENKYKILDTGSFDNVEITDPRWREIGEG